MKRKSFFFIAFGVGNWNKNTLKLMFNKFEDYVQQLTYKNKLEIYSDGNDDYRTVLPILQQRLFMLLAEDKNKKLKESLPRN